MSTQDEVSIKYIGKREPWHDRLYRTGLVFDCNQVRSIPWDMARKFLQMGFTRSRRYANHSSGKKYAQDGSVQPQDEHSEQSSKAESARIFYEYYTKAKNDKTSDNDITVFQVGSS